MTAVDARGNIDPFLNVQNLKRRCFCSPQLLMTIFAAIYLPGLLKRALS